MADVRIVDALATGQLEAARDITIEYMALTQGEAGFPVPQDIHALPAPLRAIVDSLAERHAPPGALLLATAEEQLCGTVAMSRSTLTDPTDGVVQRLYVRAPWRRRGIAQRLMATIHEIAAREGFDRLVLNVMSNRAAAHRLYDELG